MTNVGHPLLAIPLNVLRETVEHMRAGEIRIVPRPDIATPEIEQWLRACEKAILAELEWNLRARGG